MSLVVNSYDVHRRYIYHSRVLLIHCYVYYEKAMALLAGPYLEGPIGLTGSHPSLGFCLLVFSPS